VGVVHPRVEAEAERGEPGETLAHASINQQARRPVDQRPPCRLVRMGCRNEADTSKSPSARNDHRLEHLFDRRSQRQIGIADNSGADLRLPIGAARAHCGDAVGELDLPDRAQLGGTRGAIHREPFQVDGSRDVVPATEIRE
jgi:hypothetical protein